MSKLIVSLPYPSAKPSSGSAIAGNALYTYVLSKDGLSDALSDNLSKVKTGTLSLAELPKADATVLVVPARALSWHQIDLPKIPKAKLRAALDGLLEERLLDDTKDLAFSVAPDAHTGKAAAGVWVAVCDKAWLNSCVQAFDAAGYRITQIVPQFWPKYHAIDDALDAVTLAVTGTSEEAWITRADQHGVMTVPLHQGDTSGTLQSLLAQLPANTTVGAEPAVVELAQASLAPYADLKVELRPPAAGLLSSASSLWELAQFEQSLSGDSQGMKSVLRRWQSFWQSPAWRPARWGLVALLCANIVGLNAWAWQQQASLSKKRAQLGTIFTQAFPNVKTVVDPSLQMSRELTVLRQATGANSVQNFETMLSAFSNANIPTATVFTANTAIEYVANGVTFKNTRLTAAELTAAQGRLKPLGYALTQSGDTLSLKVQVTP